MIATEDPSTTYTVPIPVGVPVTLHPQQRDAIAALRSENATLRTTLIDVTDQRDEYYRQLIARTAALQQELDKLAGADGK